MATKVSEVTISEVDIVARESGVDAVAGKLDKLANANDNVAASTEKVEAVTLSVARRIEALQRAVDADYRSEQQLAKAKRDIEAAMRQGLVTQERANQLTELAAQRYRAEGAAATVAAKQVNVLHGQTSNIAAQFQDVAVQLQAGQSPFTIALQQGTQLGAVLGPMGVAGMMRGLGAAFMSVISPVNLAIIGTIAIGGAVVQWLGSLIQQSPAAEDRLKAHSEWLHQILTGYEEATAAADKHIEEVKKLPQGAVQSDLSAKQTQDIDAYIAKLKEIQELRSASTESQMRYLAYADEADLLKAQLAQLDAIRQMQAALSDTNADLDGFITSLKQMQNATDAGPLKAYITRLLELANTARTTRGEIRATAAALDELNSSNPHFMEGLNTLSGIAKPAPTDRQRAAAARDMALGDNPDVTTRIGVMKEYNDAMARIEKQEAEAAAKKTKHKEVDYLGQTTDALKAQIAALGESTREAYIAEQVSAARVKSASAEAKAIRELAGQYYDQKSAIEAANAATQFYAETAYGAIQKLISGTATWQDTLKSLLSTLAEATLRSALLGQGPLAGIFGTASPTGGTGGLLGAIVGSLVEKHHHGGYAGDGRSLMVAPPALFMNAPRYHSGGIVGLKPDEVPAILQRGERVIPANSNSAAVMSSPRTDRGGADGPVTVNIYVSGVTDAPSFQKSAPQITSQLARAIGRARRYG